MKTRNEAEITYSSMSLEDMETLIRRAESVYEPTLENVLLFLHDPPYGTRSKDLSEYYDERRHDINIERAFRCFLASDGGPLTVLEIGCSYGLRAFILNAGIAPERRESVRFVGLDINPSAIEWADRFRLVHPANLNTQFAVCDVEKGLDLEDNSVDLVISCHVIEHLQEPEKALSEMHRVLKPGGLAVVTTPNRGSPPERFALLLDRTIFRGRLKRGHYLGTELSEDGDVVLRPAFGHGHVSEKGADDWVALCRGVGFRLQGVRSGAMMPGSPILDTHRWLFALVLMAEWITGRVPRSGYLGHWVQLELVK